MAVEQPFDDGWGLIRGDAFYRRYYVRGFRGVTATKAWLTVKTAIADADGAAIFQKAITTGNVAGTGQIEDAGSTGTAIFRFDVTNANTLALTADQRYYYDVQVKLSDNNILTVVKGDLIAAAEVTITIA